MHILPAVDIQNGKAVRLLRGDKNNVTVYSDSPLDMAKRWEDSGATWLHVVDLDGAFDGDSSNECHIKSIAKSLSIPIEVGGGIRSVDKIERLLDYGVSRVILGTTALENQAVLEEAVSRFPGSIHVGVDARNGYVAVRGWTETSGVTAVSFLKVLSAYPLGAIIYTDISRDGALLGANVAAMREACAVSKNPLIASGGVTTLDDIRLLKELPLFGIIIGKALYDGKITLEDAIAVLDE